MNELRAANKRILRFIESGLGLEDGISRMKRELQHSFHFSGADRFSRQVLRECYSEFEEWLSGLMIAEPLPGGIAGLYFGLYELPAGGFGLYVTGSRKWSRKDPDWACDNYYRPDSGHIDLSILHDIACVFSEFNHTGLYLAITIVAMYIREFTANSMISLLDIDRESLYIACGIDNGDLYNIGRLFDDGLQPPGRRLFLLD